MTTNHTFTTDTPLVTSDTSGYVDELLTGQRNTSDSSELALLEKITQVTRNIESIGTRVDRLRFKIAVRNELKLRLERYLKKQEELHNTEIQLVNCLDEISLSLSEEAHDLITSSPDVVEADLSVLLSKKDLYREGSFSQVQEAENDFQLVTRFNHFGSGLGGEFILQKIDTPHRIHKIIETVAELPQYCGDVAPSLREMEMFTLELVLHFLDITKKDTDPVAHFLTIARIIGALADGKSFGLTKKANLFHLLSALAARLKLFDTTNLVDRVKLSDGAEKMEIDINKHFTDIETCCFGILSRVQKNTQCDYVFGLGRGHVPGGEGIVGQSWEDILFYHCSALVRTGLVQLVCFSDADYSFQELLVEAKKDSQTIRSLFLKELESSRFYQGGGIPPTIGFLARSYIEHLDGDDFDELRLSALFQEYRFEDINEGVG